MWIYYAVGAAITWGLEYALLDRILGGKVSPVFLRTLQMLAGFLAFGIAACASGKLVEDAQQAIADRGTLFLIAISLCTFSLANLLIALSIRDGNALLAGLVEMSYPIFIVMFSLLLFGAMHVTAHTVAGGGLIMLGIAVLKHGS